MNNFIDVIEENSLTESYKKLLDNCYEWNGTQRVLNSDKITDMLTNAVAIDIKTAKRIISNRLKDNSPLEGDYIEFEGRYYTLIKSSVSKNIFQYTNSHYLFISEAYSSYLGGFSSKINNNGLIKKEDLKKSSLLREGKFWFFSQNDSIAHNGVTMNGLFKIWHLK